jgi:CRP-like cAMP-binding protein
MEHRDAPSEYKRNLEVLAHLPLFSGTPVEVLKLIAYFSTRETYKAGEYIFREGELDANAYHILKGRAVLTISRNGEESVCKEYGEDSFMGGLSLLVKMKRLLSLKAVTELNCMVIHGEKFTRMLEKSPEIIGKMMQANIRQIYEWELKFINEHARSHPDCDKFLGLTLI